MITIYIPQRNGNGSTHKISGKIICLDTQGNGIYQVHVCEEIIMIHKNLTTNQGNPAYHKSKIMKWLPQEIFLLFLFVAVLPFQGYAAPPSPNPTYPINPDVKTTRQQTVRPVSIAGAKALTISQVSQYEPNGYSWWNMGAGVDAGPLLPDGSAVGAHHAVESLLTFFSMSDVHITDKESPAQALYAGVTGTFGETNTSAYSPIILSTTQVLDAAIQTINVLHRQSPFDFGIGLGDAVNNNQYNELRWYIDVIDGKPITPSSGANRGANFIDYQRPYQAVGLDKSISWYQTIGNHDQFWCGTLLYNDYARSILVGDKVINMGVDSTGFPTFARVGAYNYSYTGVIDGETKYGTVIDAGSIISMPQPIIAADPNRYALSTDQSTSLRWMAEFFNTTSNPIGHGFTQTNLDNDFASYTFEPKPNIKVIVLDDTCKNNPYASSKSSYARGCLDSTRYTWLKNELYTGQTSGKLMIIAAHVPVGPQLNVPNAPIPRGPGGRLGGPPNTTVIPLFLSNNNAPAYPYNVVTDAMLLTELHNYPNLLLWISGHRHLNTVTPQPAPAGKGPEYGFWEVETASLRDSPQQFRTFEIVRNNNNTVSMFITNVDPAVQGTGSPAEKSRGYAIGANRIRAGILGLGLVDTTSHAYNAELIKVLPSPQ